MVERSGGGNEVKEGGSPKFSRPRPGVDRTHPWRSALFPFSLSTPASAALPGEWVERRGSKRRPRDAPNRPEDPPPSPGPRGLSPAYPARPSPLPGSLAPEGRVPEPGKGSAQDPRRRSGVAGEEPGRGGRRPS